MSRKLFTDDEVLALEKNPCVERVSNLTVSFTEEFKQTTYNELLAGKPIWQILKDHGIDTDALGPVRVMKFQQTVKDCAEREDGFKNMRNTNRGKKNADNEEAEPPVFKRIRSLEGRLKSHFPRSGGSQTGSRL